MKQKITKDMNINEILQKYPETARVLLENGIFCVGCHAAQFETLEQGLTGHGIDKKKIDEIIKKLNDSIKK